MRSYPSYPDTPVYDASGYTGISFLAKVGSDAIDLKEMYGLEFYFTTNVHFEVWVDDLKFTTN